MEVKKIIVFIIIVILLFSSCVFGDITQYKQIGDTEYYLVESTGNVPYVNIHYYKYKDGFGESVKYKGFAKDIYWNDEFIIVKCTNRDSRIIINYCIIEQHSRNNTYAPWKVYEYATEKDFEEAKRKYGLEEEKMNHTDSSIPWRLHW